jgi:bifunctional non-homologous end joining protein LigD
MPIDWKTLTAANKPSRFTIRTVPAYLARLRTDPWRDYWRTKQSLPI